MLINRVHVYARNVRAGSTLRSIRTVQQSATSVKQERIKQTRAEPHAIPVSKDIHLVREHANVREKHPHRLLLPQQSPPHILRQSVRLLLPHQSPPHILRRSVQLLLPHRSPPHILRQSVRLLLTRQSPHTQIIGPLRHRQRCLHLLRCYHLLLLPH